MRHSIRVDADALDAAAEALHRDLEQAFGPGYAEVSAAFAPAGRAPGLSTVDGTPLVELAAASHQLGEYVRLADAALADLRLGTEALVAAAHQVARAYRDSDATSAADVRAAGSPADR